MKRNNQAILNKSKPEMPRAKKILFAFISVVVLSLVGVLGTVAFVVSASRNPDFPLQFGVGEPGAPIKATPFQPSDVAIMLASRNFGSAAQVAGTAAEAEPAAETAKLINDRLNIFLLGADDFGENNFRTDVIMYLSIDTKQGTASLISFPRDLYVNVPGYYENRINTVWGMGGLDLLNKTFESNFGIRADYYALVNYNGFKDVVNSLGGIEVDVTQYLADECELNQKRWCELQPGVYHMDGGTALWYARSRKTTNDFDRNRRAQDVIQAIAKKAFSLGTLSHAPELYRQYREYVDTNVKLSFLLPLLPMAPNIIDGDALHRYGVTSEMAYDWVTVEGSAVLVPVPDAIQAMLQEALSQ